MTAIQSLGIDWKLLLAQIINFLILLLLLWKFLYGPITGMLQDRKKRIEQGLKDAEEAKQKLAEATEQTRKLVSEAALESEKIIKTAKREMEADTKAKLDAAQKKAEQIVADSRSMAAEEQKKIVEKAKIEISDLAVSISEKILEKEVERADVQKTIEQI